jgi:TfoX/Sxy family transcriptional regulator of competence genes
MAKWQKSDPELVAAFDAALPLTAGVERRQMFGCPCAFIHGNLFAGVHEQRLFLRLPSEAALRPFSPMGAASKSYAAIEDALDCEPREFREWIARAFAYTQALPPKVKQVRPAAKVAPKKAAPRTAATARKR